MSNELIYFLRQAVPGAPLLIGTIVQESAGEYTIQQPDGSLSKARSVASFSVGTTVLFRPGGVIESEAPGFGDFIEIDV
ncbi:MAG: hypothetical protein JSR83_10155 [Proteobacteria bacterium]|nr:hypothetical protein [Pseudomonadota bacterium]